MFHFCFTSFHKAFWLIDVNSFYIVVLYIREIFQFPCEFPKKIALIIIISSNIVCKCYTTNNVQHIISCKSTWNFDVLVVVFVALLNPLQFILNSYLEKKFICNFYCLICDFFLLVSFHFYDDYPPTNVVVIFLGFGNTNFWNCFMKV